MDLPDPISWMLRGETISDYLMRTAEVVQQGPYPLRTTAAERGLSAMLAALLRRAGHLAADTERYIEEKTEHDLRRGRGPEYVSTWPAYPDLVDTARLMADAWWAADRS